jgi:hypothetical protein
MGDFQSGIPFGGYLSGFNGFLDSESINILNQASIFLRTEVVG